MGTLQVQVKKFKSSILSVVYFFWERKLAPANNSLVILVSKWLCCFWYLRIIRDETDKIYYSQIRN